MSFLYAGAVALGLAIVVPIILHLRRRRTDRRVSFPALRYLSRAEDARSKSLVASDVLLLAVRIGLLLALALAAAGPLLGRGGARDHAPTDLALVIDNSASVGRWAGDAPLFDALVEGARRSLAAARAEDRVWVFPTVGPPLAAGVGAARAVEALDRLEQTDGAADLGEVVDRAAASLPADAGREREIQLLSDLQATSFSRPREGGSDPAPLVAYAPPPPSEPNAAIADLQVSGGPSVPSGVGHGVIVRTARAGATADDSAAREADTRLEVDGRIVGAARAPWGATATLGLPELGIGPHEITVEVDPAGSRADDLRHYALRVVAPPVVRFYGPSGSFVSVGIETLTRAGRLGSGAAVAVAVVEEVETSPPETAATLVLLPPADPVRLPAFNQRLAQIGAGWRGSIDATQGDLGLEEPGTAFSLAGIRVRTRYRLRASEGGRADTTLIATDDGEPWLVRTEAEGRQVLLLASPLTLEATDLPAHPAMIPFLEALLIQWSHAASWPPSDFEAGRPLVLPGWAVEVTRPDGSPERVEGGGWYAPVRAGVYAVRGANTEGVAREAHFAVNVAESEIDPEPASGETLEELFPGRPVFLAGPENDSWEDGVYRSRRGRDAAPWLLFLALGLIAAELVLATPGRARRAAGPPESTRARSEATSRASS